MGWVSLKFEHAVALLWRMPEKVLKPNSFTHNSAISACAECGRDDGATLLLSEMWETQEMRVPPDAFSCSPAFTAGGNGNNSEKASKLKKEMTIRGIKGGGAL